MGQNRVKALKLISFPASSLDGSYHAMNTTGIEGSCFLINITSTSSTAVTISYDGGVTDHEILPGGGYTRVLNFQTNAQPSGNVALMQKGQIFYINGSVGTGTIWISGYYVSN
jgi:hypothetical protein